MLWLLCCPGSINGKFKRKFLPGPSNLTLFSVTIIPPHRKMYGIFRNFCHSFSLQEATILAAWLSDNVVTY